MKVLSSLGALVVFVAVAAGTASVLGVHPENARALTASTMPVGVTPSSAAKAVPSPSANPTPNPSPRAPAPAPRKAATPPSKAPAPPVHRSVPPAIVVGSIQQALINQDRARYGLAPLTWISCLASIAYSNAYRMAKQGYISHTDGPTRDLGCRLGYQAGENVGWWSGGVNDAQINSMFMNSPDHKANILGHFHYVATAWVTASNGRGYIAVEFS